MNDDSATRRSTLERPQVKRPFESPARENSTKVDRFSLAVALVVTSLVILWLLDPANLALRIVSIITLISLAEVGLGMLVGGTLRSGKREWSEPVAEAVPLRPTDSARRPR